MFVVAEIRCTDGFGRTITDGPPWHYYIPRDEIDNLLIPLRRARPSAFGQ
jgi:hypothetical protein